MLKIGGKGTVKLRSPFDVKVPSNLVIEVTADRTIRDLNTAGLDPFKNIYEENGIEDRYEEDLRNNVVIYTIEDDSGGTTYIPYPFVITRLDGTGYEFQEKTFGVSVGLLPKGYDTTEIEAKLMETIQETIGITPEVKAVATSATIALSENDANLIGRRISTPDMTSCRVRYKQLIGIVESVKCKNRALMCKIKECCNE